MISDGVYAKELGGGVSQVATTTFNAAFFAGMQDVEHKAHSFYIDRYPVGREATVVWPTIDWDISASTSSRYDPRPPKTRHLTGAGCVPNRGYDGFDIDVYRMFRRHGSRRLDHRETMHTSYLPSDTVDCS